MSDDLVTLRESELRERLADAWDEGFEQGQEAGAGGEWTNNPHKYWCRVAGCGRPLASSGARLCTEHRQALATLLAASGGLPDPPVCPCM